MKQLVRGLLVAMVFGACSSTAYGEGTGAEGYFTVHNDTNGNVVSGFYTNDGSGWSSNWLSLQLRPGEETVAEFLSESGACDQMIQVGWVGDNGNEVLDDPISIDICDASNVYLSDNNITYD